MTEAVNPNMQRGLQTQVDRPKPSENKDSSVKIIQIITTLEEANLQTWFV